MVKDLPKKYIPEVCEKVWPLSREPEHQFYPLFENEEDLRQTLSWTCDDYGSRAYGYWYERVLEGVCCLFIEEEEKYVLIIAIYAWGSFKNAANAFLRRIFEDYPDYEIETGIAGEHTRFAEKLIRAGFRLRDDRFNMRHPLPAQIANESQSDLELCVVEAEALEAYAPLHAAWFHDSMSSADTLAYDPQNRLIVTARRAGSVVGAIVFRYYAGTGYLDGLHAEDARMVKALFLDAMQKIAQRNKTIAAVEWMIRRSDPNLAILYDLGFTQVAHFTLYRRDGIETKQHGKLNE